MQPLYKYSKYNAAAYKDFKSHYLYLAHCFKTFNGSLVITEDQDEMLHGLSFYQSLHCLVCCVMNAAPSLRLFC